jgi:2-hydroxy-3-keto-5-methylthiopentenyl-1-phosphate phosphatase
MKRVILCDFDGTITDADVTDTLCRRFIPQHREELRRQSRRWEAGEISAVEWEEIAYGLMDLRQEQVDAVLEEIGVCSGLQALLEVARCRGWDFHVLSSGFDYYIRKILARVGCEASFTANSLWFGPEGEVRLSFLNNDEPGCDLYKPPCIGCKPVVWEDWKARGYQIAFVGDGVSDYCLAARWERLAEPGDLLFAKASLLRYCREHGIPAFPYESLADVAAYLLAQDGDETQG